MKPVSLGIPRAHDVSTPGNRGGLTGSYEVDCQAFLRLWRRNVPEIAPLAFIVGFYEDLVRVFASTRDVWGNCHGKFQKTGRRNVALFDRFFSKRREIFL